MPSEAGRCCDGNEFRALGGLRVNKGVIWSRQNGNLSLYVGWTFDCIPAVWLLRRREGRGQTAPPAEGLSCTNAKNQLGLGLSPLKDRRSDCLLHDLFRLPAAVDQSCNITKPAGQYGAQERSSVSKYRIAPSHHRPSEDKFSGSHWCGPGLPLPFQAVCIHPACAGRWTFVSHPYTKVDEGLNVSPPSTSPGMKASMGSSGNDCSMRRSASNCLISRHPNAAGSMCQ